MEDCPICPFNLYFRGYFWKISEKLSEVFSSWVEGGNNFHIVYQAGPLSKQRTIFFRWVNSARYRKSQIDKYWKAKNSPKQQPVIEVIICMIAISLKLCQFHNRILHCVKEPNFTWDKGACYRISWELLNLWLRDLTTEKAKHKKCNDGCYKRFESAVQGGAQLYCIGRNPFKEILPYYFANIAHGTTDRELGGFAKVTAKQQ